MTDFFISYTSADKEWAEWIGYMLEEESYSVILQAWDFRPGSNFVLEMQEAAKKAERTIMVLSPNYLKSQFANPEWSSAFAADPQGLKRALLPVIVRDCKPDGLLGQIVHINLIDMDQETARSELLSGIRPERAKPSSSPIFPGSQSRPRKAHSASLDIKGSAPFSVYVPKIGREPSDIEKRKFLKSAFDITRSYFDQALRELSKSHQEFEFDFQLKTTSEFTAEIFLRGESISACRIWRGGMFSEDAISYGEGRQNFGSNSCNESLTVTTDENGIALSSMMGSFGRGYEHIDLKRMCSEEAAEYLWRRFTAYLENRR